MEIAEIARRLRTLADEIEGSPVVEPVVETPIVDTPVVTDGKLPARIENTTLIQNYCYGGCEYITSEYYEGLKRIIQKLNALYPNRMAKKLEVCDACPQNGTDCPHGLHPPGLHSKWKAVDAHYFTLGPHNHTQVDPDHSGNIVQIFDDTGELNTMFDGVRLLDFLLLYLEEFPDPVIYTDERIKTHLWMIAGSNRGLIEAKIKTAMYHDKHIHLGYCM